MIDLFCGVGIINVTRVYETQLTHPTPWTLSYRLATQRTEMTKCLRALSSSRQWPEYKFLEFGGPCRAPEPSLWANSPTNAWPLIIKDTSVAILPNLPCHQNYQGVEAFTSFFGDSCSWPLPPKFRVFSYAGVSFWVSLILLSFLAFLVGCQTSVEDSRWRLSCSVSLLQQSAWTVNWSPQL